MKRQRFLNLTLSAFSVGCLFFMTPTLTARADDLVSLDDDSAATGKLESLDSLDGSAAEAAPSDEMVPTGGGDEVSLDLGADLGKGSEDFFNPYVVSRDPRWIFLPLFGIVILILHLLPVPKRKAKRQIDQAKRFFRGISGAPGEGTGTATSRVKNYREVDPHAAPVVPAAADTSTAPESPAAPRIPAAPKIPTGPAIPAAPSVPASDATVVAKVQPRSITGGRPSVLTQPIPDLAETEALEIIEPSHEFEPIAKKKKGGED